MARPRIAIPLGAGLDRATGAGVVDPRSMQEALNLIALEGAVALRPGLQLTGFPAYNPAEVTNPATDMLVTQSVEATRHVLQVTFDRVSRRVSVWCLNPVGPTKQFVADLGTLNASALFPVIIAAESYGRMFFAHAEPTMVYRFPTKYWAPGALDTDPGTLTTLQADLDGAGAANVSFYTVAAHGSYLAGAGFGTAADKDRPEQVRISVGADTTIFKPETYYLCGPRGQRIEALGSMPDGLICAAALRRHVITGSAPDDFGADIGGPPDTTNGCTSPRGLAVIAGVCHFWSATGPRSTTSALTPSEDRAIPLSLFEAQPAGLPASGPDRLRFTAYDPVERLLYYVAPDAETPGDHTFAYIASLRNPNAIRFTYAVWPRLVLSAGLYYTGKVPPVPGTGYAAAMAAVDDGYIAPAGRRVTLTWNNTANDGSETCELWQKTGTGAWALAATFAVSGVTTTQSRQVAGLDPLTDYAFAVRLRTIAGGYTPGFSEATPNLWSSGSAAGAMTTITTGCATPAITSALYQRLNATDTQVALAWTIAEARAALSIERKVDAGAYSVVALTAAGDLGYTYTPDPSEIGHTLTFKIQGKNGAHVGTFSAPVASFAGYNGAAPTVLLVVDETFGLTSKKIRFWIDGTFGVSPSYLNPNVYQIEEIGQVNVITTIVPTKTAGVYLPVVVTTFTSVVSDGGVGTFNFRVRGGIAVSGVTDWGPWGGNVTRACNPASTTAAQPTFGWDPPEGTLGDGGLLPLDFTPEDVTAANLQLWLTSSFTDQFDPTPMLYGPYVQADNGVLQTVTLPTGLIFPPSPASWSGFILDTTFGVRGPVVVMFP